MFPLLSPTTFFLLVINIVYAFFDTFGVIHAITEGGPQQATTILVYKVYSDGFVGLDLGGSAAQSVILMVIVGRADRGPVPLRRAAGALLMARAQVRAWSKSAARATGCTHVGLIIGVLFIVFPIYLTFVASTRDASPRSCSPPMPLLPGRPASARTTRKALVSRRQRAGRDDAAELSW